jgi:hypothetical protein
MYGELRNILKRLGRRLRLTRAMEQAAAGAVAGAVAGAALQGAWLAAGQSASIATALLLVPAALAWPLVLVPAARWRLGLDAAQAAAVAAVLLAAAMAGATALLTGWHDQLAGWVLPLCLVPASALVCGAVESWRHRDLGRVAQYLDYQYDLQQRASSAWELAGRHSDGPVTQLVMNQAAARLREPRVRKGTMWNRGPRTPAALLLGLLLCGALAGVELAGRATPPLDGALSRAIASADPADQALLAQNLREAARLLADNPQLAQAARDAAAAADQSQKQRLEDLLAQLASAGVDVQAMLPPGMNDSGQPPANDATAAGEAGDESPFDEPGQTSGWVFVHSPADQTPPAGDPDDDGPAGAEASFEAMWSAAGRDATARGDQLPTRYRALVRDFFAPQR